MNITLYRKDCDNKRVDKIGHIFEVVTLSGTLRTECSILKPSVLIELNAKNLQQIVYRGRVIDDSGNLIVDDSGNPVSWLYYSEILTANYARIPEFDRYYYITDITAVNNRLFRIDLQVDPLMSFKQEILALSPVIARYQNSMNYRLADPQARMPANASYTVNNSSGNNPFSITQSNWTFMLSALVSWTVPGGMLIRATTHTFNNNAKVVMNYSDVKTLIDSLNNPDFLKAMGNLFANEPLQSILSLRLYPCNLYEFLGVDSSDTPDNISIGTYSTGATGYLVPSLVDTPSSCSKWLPRIYAAAPSGASSWSYYNDDVQVYLPFYGFFSLPPEQYYGRYIWPKYTIDFETGNCYINVYSSASSTSSGVDEDELVYMCSCKIGTDVPVSQGSATEQLRNGLLGGMTALLSIAAAPASGGLSLAGLGASIAGQLNNMQPKYSHGGNSGGPFNIYFSELDPFALVGHTAPDYPANYAATFGYPYNESAQLSTLTGFVQVDEVHLNGFHRALTEELVEIERSLKAGVIV